MQFENEYKYLVERKKIYSVLRNLNNKRVFLVTSDLGNGKTIFLNILKNEFISMNYHVFTFKQENYDAQTEIEKISYLANNNKKVVVFIDNYKSKINILKNFGYFGNDNIIFVISARSYIISNNRISSSLKITEDKFMPINLNILTEEELREFSQIICDESIYFSELKNSEGTTPDDVYNYIEKNNYNKFADLLLELYKSSDIHHRINEVWENNKNENKDIKQLAILAIMKFVMQINLEFNEMLDLLELDYAILSKYNSELIKEFFDVNADDDVKIRSSVIAKEILYNIIGLEDLITTMTELVKQAGERCQINIKYGEFIKNLVSHSHFYNFKNKPEAGCLILKFYNDIRNVESCKDNHFFWVQYASVCIDLCEFQVANTCLDNAYNMSKSIPSFVPYQIDTTKARLKLEKILFNINSGDKYNSEEVIDIITEATKLLTKNIDHPDNNVNYVFRLALKFTDIFDNYKEDFDKRQKSIFTEKIVLLVKLMKTHQDKIGFNTKWIEKLEACKF